MAKRRADNVDEKKRMEEARRGFVKAHDEFVKDASVVETGSKRPKEELIAEVLISCYCKNEEGDMEMPPTLKIRFHDRKHFGILMTCIEDAVKAYTDYLENEGRNIIIPGKP